MKFSFLKILIFSLILISSFCAKAQGFEGYYQFPDIHKNTIAFCAEGDIWTVNLNGGIAQRLTTHDEEELYPKISPDGKTLMFSATYEGPTELYTMPITGGITKRWTYETERSLANTWTANGEMVYATFAYNKKPDYQLVKINPENQQKTFIPLDQASEATFNDTGNTVYFVRPAFHRNVTKRYKGGTARQIWKFTEGTDEAVKLTTDYAGESHHPMWFDGRVYFITDRDGVMNIWSMNENGKDLKQHTEHTDFDVRYASISEGIIVYQMAADLWKYDVETDISSKIKITLATDADQLREKWEENPQKYISKVNTDKEGENIIITARGRMFVVPVSQGGRLVAFTENSDIRYRDAFFSHDGKNIIALSDETGEFEFVSQAKDGTGNEKQITSDGKLLRFEGLPSPDGKFIAYADLEDNLYLLNIESGKSTKISTNQEGIGGFSWSPDSQWLAFVQSASNTMAQIFIYDLKEKSSFELTTDRANSSSPCWSADGKFIYFISDRSFTTIVGSPWGTRQPEPYFDASEKIYHIALQKNYRSPFRPNDELLITEAKKDKKKKDGLQVKIDKENIQKRIEEVPVKAGNYRNMAINDNALYFISSETGLDAKSHLAYVKITNEKPEVATMLEDIIYFKPSGNGKKLLIKKEKDYYMCAANASKIAKLGDAKIDLSKWKFPITPIEEWRQMFKDAWRMERDYFYDENMHGVDWNAMYTKYYPLVDRITTRAELSDLIGRFVGELSALHTSVRGGDIRVDEKNIPVDNLGGIFTRNEEKGGFVIDYIYKADPDYPHEKSPLDDPYLDVKIGDVITKINGIDALSATDIGELLRNQAGKQVRLSLKSGKKSRDIIVEPINYTFNLRYRDWEYGNRQFVEENSEDEIGYLHLRAMGRNDINQFAREFYPVFNRKGLIIDVRYNFGGNIDSYILEKLLRKAWMYWQGRSGEPSWNMQYAFRGHIVVLVNENTYSDGEAFADGFRRLGLGTTIGTRTWGGEIWLNSSNRLSDGGLARAPMFGVYNGDEWLIEGHGFEPDIEIDNLPHATFKGKDVQLEKAIEYLQQKIKDEPITVPQPPAFPDKSFDNNRK